MHEVGVVVLNYEKYDETINCVDSLVEQLGIVLRIVIVDNGSQNESVEILRRKYNEFDFVKIINSKENLGFARGMNLGIDYLRSKKISFIFLANSDLIFTDHYILSDMLKMNEDVVGVICPFIKNVDGTYAVKCTFKKKLMYLRMIRTFIEGWNKHLKQYLQEKGVIKINKSLPETKIQATGQKNVVLTDRYEITGSGYMYTPSFFDHYSRMYPETFLYNEEYATCIYLKKAGLSTAWADTKPIIHKHGASTPQKSMWSNDFKRKIRKNRWIAIVKLMLMPKKMIVRRYG